MHRDLKPQNILFDDNFNIKVVRFMTVMLINWQIDFGDSKLLEKSDISVNGLSNPDDMKKSHALERRQTFVGTLNYISPEMAE